MAVGGTDTGALPADCRKLGLNFGLLKYQVTALEMQKRYARFGRADGRFSLFGSVRPES
jgi:hypothetical protein